MNRQINLRKNSDFARSEEGAAIIKNADFTRRNRQFDRPFYPPFHWPQEQANNSRGSVPFSWLKQVFTANGVSLTVREKVDNSTTFRQKQKIEQQGYNSVRTRLKVTVRRADKEYKHLDVRGVYPTAVSIPNARKALQVLGLL